MADGATSSFYPLCQSDDNDPCYAAWEPRSVGRAEFWHSYEVQIKYAGGLRSTGKAVLYWF